MCIILHWNGGFKRVRTETTIAHGGSSTWNFFPGPWLQRLTEVILRHLSGFLAHFGFLCFHCRVPKAQQMSMITGQDLCSDPPGTPNREDSCAQRWVWLTCSRQQAWVAGLFLAFKNFFCWFPDVCLHPLFPPMPKVGWSCLPNSFWIWGSVGICSLVPAPALRLHLSNYSSYWAKSVRSAPHGQPHHSYPTPRLLPTSSFFSFPSGTASHPFLDLDSLPPDRDPVPTSLESSLSQLNLYPSPSMSKALCHLLRHFFILHLLQLFILLAYFLKSITSTNAGIVIYSPSHPSKHLAQWLILDKGLLNKWLRSHFVPNPPYHSLSFFFL